MGPSLDGLGGGGETPPNLKRHVWLTAYVPLIVWTVVVLGLGSGVGASNETSRFLRPLLEFLFPAAEPETLALYHAYIRKFAHFAEYAVLAFLAVRALAGWTLKYIAAFFFVLAVALVDETNQSFNPSRTSSPWDVLLDVAGGLSMMIFCWFIELRGRRGAGASRPS